MLIKNKTKKIKNDNLSSEIITGWDFENSLRRYLPKENFIWSATIGIPRDKIIKTR